MEWHTPSRWQVCGSRELEQDSKVCWSLSSCDLAAYWVCDPGYARYAFRSIKTPHLGQQGGTLEHTIESCSKALKEGSNAGGMTRSWGQRECMLYQPSSAARTSALQGIFVFSEKPISPGCQQPYSLQRLTCSCLLMQSGTSSSLIPIPLRSDVVPLSEGLKQVIVFQLIVNWKDW